MDPITVKLIQRGVIAVAGVGALTMGILMLWRGIKGKSSLILKGHGVNAKLLNASPGLFIALLGGSLLYLSVAGFKVTQTITEHPALEGSDLLEVWLSAATRLSGKENYIETLDSIIGTERGRRLRVENIVLSSDQTLGSIAKSKYGDPKFWKLLAAANKDRGYFDFVAATPDTTIKASKLVEVWRVSKFAGKDTKTILEVSTGDRNEAYDELLAMADKHLVFEKDVKFDRLNDEFKKRELALGLGPAHFGDDVETLGELALKYYGAKKYYKLIAWTNPSTIPPNAGANWKLPRDRELTLIYFIP